MELLNVSKHEIKTHGIYRKSVYGICKKFEWKQYNYKGRRFNISQFNNDIEEINKIYCECCGKPYFPSFIKIVFGLNTCRYCAKAING